MYEDKNLAFDYTVLKEREPVIEANTYQLGQVIPTMWHFDKCKLRQACAAPF